MLGTTDGVRAGDRDVEDAVLQAYPGSLATRSAIFTAAEARDRAPALLARQVEETRELFLRMTSMRELFLKYLLLRICPHNIDYR